MADLLLVEDEANARRILALGLELQGHRVQTCASPEEAEACMKAATFDVVLTDLRMEGRDAGLDVIRMSQTLQPDARVLLLTAYASADTAVLAMKQGAFDYLTKPVSGEELAAAVERALFDAVDDRAETGSVVLPEPPIAGDASEDGILIGNSAAMQRVRQRLQRAGKSQFTVLISGESGTGKELAARYVHASSARSKEAFTPVHCGAIPEGLFESELFGYRKGAFTGAETDRAGLIESTNGGTLFLDEIGDMPLSAQVKLLRVLQERRIRRVGDERERDVDIRVIAATNRDLEADVRQGHFREDLFFRLNVVPVHMPALRQRREDIPALARVIVRRWSEGRGRLSEACLNRLMTLPFMGNVRELENLLQRMLALSDNHELDIALLDEMYSGLQSHPQVSLQSLQEAELNLDTWLETNERQLIEQALLKTGGNITRAAEELGISFRSLRYRLKKTGQGDDLA
ncbi:MAG: DNA-binding response regulator [Zetaproteobacteria bacterium CG12_big_fil_rev_8_21_14_0_65_54_13]|nr:MAG: DNA-binding response regulator [Zetaproteobacteria bacterium CG23_combo_of_CG06-09_8_20_14_all_54_7]PIW51252.1 MAG: DNA-binding response regulator [Zetaproteobacteria bacterium CG12_big_fil_rev_8_21_14_0_65_54_13]PIX53550.1 MAG: DNA-binding response regulator [Zetaproteobacteria bacterium CG_4_10_14_3_um_filter_54_28]PJA28361.1 MAG: DNA-binding response regulator [Zetaproteobacteria bacterium CG_4_9_14_3_um_filter_54_145]